MVFRQIVGLVARRVVTRVEKGDVLRTGQRIGLMKFGSRMDVFVPAPRRRWPRRVGDRTVAGETVIGRWPLLSSGQTEKSGRRLLDRWRLKSPSGAAVVSLRQLSTARAAAGHRAEHVHHRQHGVRVLGDPARVRRRVHLGRRPAGRVDRARHRRRRGGPARRGDLAVRRTAGLAGRPGLLRPRAGRAGAHLGAAGEPGRSRGSPRSSGWPARRSGWPGSTSPSTRSRTRSTSSGCPAPARPWS